MTANVQGIGAVPGVHSRPPHSINLVRPGPTSLSWLQSSVASVQDGDSLRRVSVVVASPYLAAVVKRALAEVGCANVRLVLLRQVAQRVAGSAAYDGRRELTGVLEQAAIRQALQDDAARPFESVAHHQSLHDGLGQLFRELRHHDDIPDALSTLADGGTVQQAALATYQRFKALSGEFHGAPELARIAATAAQGKPGAWVESLGALVVYLPARLDTAELAMLGQIGRRLPIMAALPWLGEPAADTLMRETAHELAAALNTTVDEPAPVAAVPSFDVISAPDPSEEVRTVVRRIAADLEQEISLWRIAVVYGSDETYGGLIREALDAAELPWHASTGRPLIGYWAAQSLHGLLGQPERRFAREAVLEWLNGRPNGVSDSDPLPSIPVSAWDRLSRQAQVLEGPQQWGERLQALAQALSWRDRQGHADDDDDERPALTGDAAVAITIGQAIKQLSTDTTPPRDGSSWDAFVDWAADLRRRYVAMHSSWPAAERASSEAVDVALESLRDAATFERGTKLTTFTNALASILASRRMPEGVFGRGVLVGPAASVVGAAYQRVYLLGVTEGTFPARPPSDPLSAGAGHHDPLQRRERAREADRRAFLAALAAADDGQVTLSYPRSDGGSRATYPSRWLLELASEREGRPIYASQMPVLLASGRPWITRVASVQDGVLRVARGTLPAADLADARLASVVVWRSQHGDLARHPLATRRDLPLAAALRASDARRSRAFSAYDGNLGELAGNSSLMVRAFASGKVSATGIERWAGCHFRYLLQDVLGVQATHRPEDEWTITSLDRGTLVHRILDRFFRELRAADRLRGGDRITAADHDRLDVIAQDVFSELEAQGKTGHPLAWENARTAILLDLHELLEKDQAWRDTSGLVPVKFEQSFGRPSDPHSWPALTLTLIDGTRVSFSGQIDRIDAAKGSAPRAQIIDYKTGSTGSYADLEGDPLAGGRHVQLAIYAQAMQNQLPAEEPWDLSAEFRFVTARGGFKQIQVSSGPALEQRLGQVIQWVADGVGGGTFLPVPGDRDRGTFKNCAYCDYDRVCSATRAETWERKHGAVVPLDMELDVVSEL
jgi:ATP-dependent helicase/nuclease subunit B